MRKFLRRCLLLAVLLFVGARLLYARAPQLSDWQETFAARQTGAAQPLAATGGSRAVIGADLSDEQVEAVYRCFGVTRGSVTELRLTNAEERLYLGGAVDAASIGTRTVSSVYVERLPAGSGLEISTVNIGWTPEMYRSALETAGLGDARIVVAAPFEVSGTGALAGIYKAYESMDGQGLDDSAKSLGTQELSILGELAGEIGGLDSAAIVRELKQRLEPIAQMTDDELRQEIRSLSAAYHVSLSDRQVERLVSLCRALGSLDAEGVRSRVERLQGTLETAEQFGEKSGGFFAGLGSAARNAADFFDSLGRLFG